MSDHHEVYESLGAFVLGALPEDERAAVAKHVAACPVCTEDAAALQQAALSLADAVPSLEPPADLRRKIMAVVEAEAELLHPSPSRSPRRSSSRPALTPRWVAMTAALLVGGGVIGAALQSAVGPDTRTIAADARGAQARLEVVDGDAQLVVAGLPAPTKGRVYEVWVQRGDAAPRPAGALFVMRSGRIGIPIGLSAGDRVMVTDEPAGGSAQPTTQPIVTTSRV